MSSECEVATLPAEILDRLGSGQEAELGVIRVRTPSYERQEKILSWRGYGVVSPGNITTNGDPSILAKAIVLDYLDRTTHPAEYQGFSFSYPAWLESVLAPVTEENHRRVTSALGWLLFRAYKAHSPGYQDLCRGTTSLCAHGQTCASTKRDRPCY
jgi:hypothetical protein